MDNKIIKNYIEKTIENYNELKIKNEDLNGIANFYLDNAFIEVKFCDLIKAFLILNLELNGKLLANLEKLVCSDMIWCIKWSDNNPYLCVDCITNTKEKDKTFEMYGVYITINLKTYEIIKGLNLCRLFHPNWFAYGDMYDNAHDICGNIIEFNKTMF